MTVDTAVPDTPTVSGSRSDLQEHLTDSFSNFGKFDEAKKARERPELTAAASRRSRVPPIVRLLRPHQWVKNAFVASPLFFTPALVSVQLVMVIVAGMACFCALSSAVYVINDYADREADRNHAKKRHRPLAAGTVSPALALVVAGLLGLGGLAGAYALAPLFCAVAAGYLGMNLAYSFGLKNASILDVMIIALGFVLRVEAGAILIGVAPSVWIIVCTGLLALFLAIAKRRDDVIQALGQSHRRSLVGYNKSFLDNCLSISLGALLVSYIIYTTDSAVIERLGTDRLYLTVPFLLAGIMRYLQITLVEERSGSPTRIALTDRFIVLAMVGWTAVFGTLIY